MREFFQRNKVYIIVALVTIIFIAGGVLLMGGKGNSDSVSTNTISSSILVPAGAIITSGFVNGIYLPANPSAKVTLVEFGDYECPGCSIYSAYIKGLLTEFNGKINYVFRNYPLSQHNNALIASYAVEVAGIQGKYWEMHEKIYATQADWSSLPDPTSTFRQYASDLSLNLDQFASDMNSQKVKDIVQSDINDGNKVGLTSTPTFYINGAEISLNGDPTQLRNLITSDLAK